MKTTTIVRSLYVDQIKGFIDDPHVKVITGLRRSGKTEFLKMIFEEIADRVSRDHIIYINFEDMDYEDITNAKELNAYLRTKMIDHDKYYIFFDEIQLIENWEKTVNALRLRNTDIYITGSNSKIMSKELATLLGSRTISIKMNTLSFAEFMEFRRLNGIETGTIDSELEQYINIGGFPLLSVSEYTENVAREIVKGINNTTLLKDVVVRYEIRQPLLLDKLVSFLYDNVGNLISIRSIVNYFKSQGRGTDPETIANYLTYLEDAFIITPAHRYDIKGKKLLETNDKFYLGDHSLQYAIRNRRPDKVQGILENIVFTELVRRGYTVSVGKFDDTEIDFIAEEQDGTRKIYIQVCLEFTNPDTYAREFNPLKQIKDNYHKYVVTLDKNWRADENGVQGIHLKDFLLRDVL
ncbi:MAG: ATP-binding protein [Spirochaetaceae bacterium]|jgi:predicted AAA+ superfamily ATPase|nr:ATP-binding protein [Spirochaetaceae bacterium]